MLLDGGRGKFPLQVLHECRDMHGPHVRNLVQPVVLTPLGKAPRRVQVCLARVVVVDLGGEELHHPPRGFRGRREQPDGKQAGGRGGDERGCGHGTGGPGW